MNAAAAPGWFWAGLIALTGLRLWAASQVALLPDEAYYWVWSRALAPGYFDHPPMVALWIRLGTLLCGQTTLGVRLLGPVSQLAASGLLVQAAGDLLPALPRSAARAAGLLMNATLFWGVAGEVMTPDVPLMFFWVLALWAMGRLIATGQGAWWLAAGFAVGAAMISKYTALILAAGLVIWLLAARRRFWWRNPWPYLGGALSLLMFLPVLHWNQTHDWASFLRQGGRLGDFRWNRAAGSELELIAGQIALATPLAALLCGQGAWAALRRWPEPGPGLLAALIWPAALLFVQHALGDRVQANWPEVIYPAAAIAAGLAACRWRHWAAGLGLAIGVLVLAQLALGLVRLPNRLAALPGNSAITRNFVQEVVRRAGDAPYIATDDYGLAALLAWYLPGRIQVLALGDRWREFDLPPAEPVLRSAPGILMLRLRLHPGSDWAAKHLFAEMPGLRARQSELLYHLSGATPAPIAGR